MQYVFGKAYACYVQLRGKANQRLFETEIQKMKLLNIAAGCRSESGAEILAYCVLDNEMHLVLQAEEAGQTEQFFNRVMTEYEANLMKSAACQTVFRKPAVQTLLKEKQIEQYCVKVHMLPAGIGLVSRPEDYWWCSYRDYLGRRWLPLTNVNPLLSLLDENPKKAIRQIRRLHQPKKASTI